MSKLFLEFDITPGTNHIGLPYPKMIFGGTYFWWTLKSRVPFNAVLVLAYPPQYLMLCVTLYHDNIFHLGRRCLILDVSHSLSNNTYVKKTIIMSHHLLLNCGKALLLSSDPPFMSARKEIVNRKPQFLESFWNCYSAFKYPPIKFHRKSFNCESVFESSFVVWGFEFFKCWSLGVGWILQNSLSKLLIQLQFVQKHSTPLRLWKCHCL